MRIFIGLAMAMATVGGAFAADTGGGADTAQSWLSLIDRGDYGSSWAKSGALFQSQITKTDWAAKIAPVRQPLGAVVSRKLDVVMDKTALPGAPDGHYEIVRFATVFAHKDQAVETVVLAHQADGWAVDGYFIK